MLFTLPSKPTVNPTTASTTLSANFTIPAGTSIDYEGAQAGYQPAYYVYADPISGTLENDGYLWAQDANAFVIWNLGSFVNNGTIVAYSATTQEQALVFQSTIANFNNDGSVIAWSTAGAAYAVQDYSSVAVTINGLIAAYSATGDAVGWDRENGGETINAVTGRILAEGQNAIGIALGRFTFAPNYPAAFTNYGTITAVSDSANPSVGVEFASEQFAGFSQTIDNYGTITADYALYVSDMGVTPLQMGPQIVNNFAGGVINGDIVLELGNDNVTNAGMINGDVIMGDGNDIVDNTNGVINGYTQFGDGNISYYGSATSNDYVLGGGGHDVIVGGVGADLLIAGRGDSVLVSGLGNSGLYGDTGNNLIITHGGDYVVGGIGNDRIVLGDLSFDYVTGGGGNDTLVLPQGGLFLDLHAALATGRIGTFQTIEMAAGQRMAISLGDATQLAGANQPLYLNGQGSGEVDLVGNWAARGTIVANGIAYSAYGTGSDLVYVAASLTSDIVSTVPSGAQSLSSIAAGAAAPHLGSQPWAQLPSNTTNVVAYSFNTLTIAAGEVWSDTTGAAALSGGDTGALPTLVNHGTVTSTANGATGAYAAIGVADSADGGTFFNDGTISSAFTDTAAQLTSEQNELANYGLMIALNHANDYGANGIDAYTILTNIGQLTAQSASGAAVASNYFGIVNSGNISATSADFIAAGVINGGGTNSGSISAKGALAAIGVDGDIVNSGTITAQVTKSGGTAIGVADGNVINSGTITATTAIGITASTASRFLIINTGTINGAITLTNASQSASFAGMPGDVISNSGKITGQISLGASDDVYFGRYGTLIGSVVAGAGNDIIVGSAGGETLTAGSGSDILVSGGADTMIAGSGADRFVFLSIASSTAAAPATIKNFVSGTDKIDLTALGLGAVTISISGGVSTLTSAGTAFSVKVYGTVAQSDLILTASASQTATTGHQLLIAPASGGTLTADSGSCVLLGGAGNDTLMAGAGGAGNGFEILDGGGGINTAQFLGAQSEYVIHENADGTVFITDTNNNGLMATSYQLINIQNLRFTDATVNLSAASVSLDIGSNVLLLQAGQTLNLSNPGRGPSYGGSPNTITGSDGTVNLSQADAVITGANDTVTVGGIVSGSSNHVTVNGTGDSLADTGTNDVLTIGGNGQFSSSANTVSLTQTGTVDVTDNARVAVSGNGVSVNIGNADQLTLSGSGNQITSQGTGDIVQIGGNGQNATAVDGVKLIDGGRVTELDNATVSAAGNGLVIQIGNADNLAVSGLAQVVDVNGAGDAITVGGNGQNAAVADYIYASTASALTLTQTDNARLMVAGNGLAASLGNADNLGLFGAHDTATLTGTGDGVWVGGNGQSGGVDTLNFAASGFVSEGPNAAAIVNGNGVYVAGSQFDNLGLFGANDTASFSGVGIGVWVGGNGQAGSADTLNFAAGGGVSEAADAAVIVNGNGVVVTASQADNLGLFGAHDTATLTGTGDGVWVGGNGQAGGVDTLNFTSGGGVSEGSNANVAINGSGVSVVTARNDTLSLNGANDTVVITSGFGVDVISGFQASGATHDTLQINPSIFADWAHLLGATKQQGSDLVITLDASDTITLKGLTLTAGQANSFTAADVRFG